jgi:putative heme iron utilization protein
MNRSEDQSGPDGALGREARLYLRARHGAVLSTVSLKFAGYPFGSVVPFVLDQAASPIILVSQLAEHTRNLAADSRCTLIAQDPGIADLQAAARLTCVAAAQAVPESDLSAVQSRYLLFFPDAQQLLDLGDFSFRRLEVKALRFIGGFGRIHWVSAEGYAPPSNSLAEAEQSILDHMNNDHPHNIADYCRHYLGLETNAVMIGIDCDGVDLRVGAEGEKRGTLHRIDFDRTVRDADEARASLVTMAKTARRQPPAE